MITLTKEQKQIRKRIKSSIEKEIGMCDDYADLIVLASTLYDSSKTIFGTYSEKFGEEALENILKKSN